MDLKLAQPEKLSQWLRLYMLYRSAFPAAERTPFSMIRRMYRLGKSDVWCLQQVSRFAGLDLTINVQDTILLDYFAVEKQLRSHGIGAAALKLLRQKYAGKGLFIEIESTFEGIPEQPRRLRRKQFYLRCGAVPMGVMVRLFGIKMELLGWDCQLDFPQYQAFYRDNYSEWAAQHVAPEVHPENKGQ